MITLFKYSMKGDSQLSPGAQAIIQFTRGQTKPDQAPNFFPCAYLTSDNFLDSITASGYLAMTYFPKFRNDFEIDSSIQLYNNQRDQINESSLASSPRVWPAFGRLGGGHETIILDNPPLNRLSNIKS